MSRQDAIEWYFLTGDKAVVTVSRDNPFFKMEETDQYLCPSFFNEDGRLCDCSCNRCV